MPSPFKEVLCALQKKTLTVGSDTRLVLAVHLRNIALVCETEIGIVADDQVLVDRDSHDPAGMNQLAGNEPVFTGWLWLS